MVHVLLGLASLLQLHAAGRRRRLEDELELRWRHALPEVHHVARAQLLAGVAHRLAVHRDAVQGLAVMDCPLLELNRSK